MSEVKRIADMALECSDLLANRVKDPVDMVLVLSTMTASMCKVLSKVDRGYCASSALCMSIDYMLHTMKDLNEMEKDSQEERGEPPKFMRGVYQKPNRPVDI